MCSCLRLFFHVCISHGACFTDVRKFHDASLAVFVIHFCETISQTPTMDSVWKICDSLRSVVVTVGSGKYEEHFVELHPMRSRSLLLTIRLLFPLVFVSRAYLMETVLKMVVSQTIHH